MTTNQTVSVTPIRLISDRVNDIQDAQWNTVKGKGRVYTITYTATDNAGHVTTAEATVTVPHSSGKK